MNMNQKETFFIGASTSAHQVEGNNIYSDCWAMEQMKGSVYNEPSLDAADHYNRFEEDISRMAEAGYQAYRFSIEWARIEPRRGDFQFQEIEHYKNVLECCHKNGLIPIVTMHHFSSPKWLTAMGGWENDMTAELFAGYCSYVMEHVGPLIPYVCTINEANMGIQIAKIMQSMEPSELQIGVNTDQAQFMESYMKNLGDVFETEPQKVQPFISMRTPHGDEIVRKAHMAARKAIKKKSPETKVGMTFSLFDYQYEEGGKAAAQREWDEDFRHYLPAVAEDDFIGIQNYTRKIITKDGKTRPAQGKLTMAGYEYYPQALGHVIMRVAQDWKKPVIVTENGIATADDTERVAFIREALDGVKQCIESGINVLGYMHWSLLDNFEWNMGYTQTFGLIAVDRRTQKRTPKPSFSSLGEIARQYKN